MTDQEWNLEIERIIDKAEATGVLSPGEIWLLCDEARAYERLLAEVEALRTENAELRRAVEMLTIGERL